MKTLLRKYFMALLILLSPSIKGQEKRVHVIIDTIVNLNDFKHSRFFNVCVDNKNILGTMSYFDSSEQINKHSYPNYINTVTTNSDSSNIIISLDPYQSHLRIKNIKELEKTDTLIIEKITICDCRIQDTSFITKWYFKSSPREDQDFEEDAYKFIRRREINQYKCNISCPDAFKIKINNVSYKVSIDTVAEFGMDYMRGHGYTRKQKKDGSFKRNTDKFHIKSQTRRYRLAGELKLIK